GNRRFAGGRRFVGLRRSPPVLDRLARSQQPAEWAGRAPYVRYSIEHGSRLCKDSYICLVIFSEAVEHHGSTGHRCVGWDPARGHVLGGRYHLRPAERRLNETVISTVRESAVVG